MKKESSTLRWILLSFSIPVVLVGGGLFALIYADSFKVWDEYVGAFILPVIGLTAAWIIAPKHKLKVCTIYDVIGILWRPK